MHEKSRLYWVTTGLFCLVMVAGGAANLLGAAAQVEAMEALGYPLYLMTILGVAKILGVMALLSPKRPILKEWAYAGFTFDLIGASASHGLAGDPVVPTLIPLVVLSLCVGSYLTRPADRRP